MFDGKIASTLRMQGARRACHITPFFVCPTSASCKYASSDLTILEDALLKACGETGSVQEKEVQLCKLSDSEVVDAASG